MTGKVQMSFGASSYEHGVTLGFTMGGSPGQKLLENRIHQVFAESLKTPGIDWIRPKRFLWEIDLDGMRNSFPEFARAEWMRGLAFVEPDFVEIPGLVFDRPKIDLKILLQLNAQEIALSQQRRIFLSHKSTNKALVRDFYETLKLLGFEPWLDEKDMLAGDVPHRTLLEGMRSSCAAVFFITPEFSDAGFLSTEIDYANSERTQRPDRFRIITLRLANDAGERGTVPPILRQFIFKEPTSNLEALRDIVNALPVTVGAVNWC